MGLGQHPFLPNCFENWQVYVSSRVIGEVSPLHGRSEHGAQDVVNVVDGLGCVALEARTTAVQGALDSWTVGVIVLDQEARVFLMNAAAEEIIRHRDGLSVSQGSVRAGRPQESAQLAALIRRTHRLKFGRGAPSASVMTVTRQHAQRPLQLFVAPLSEHRSVLGDSRGTTVIFVSDPERVPESEAELVQRLYGLTPAEARFLIQLAGGEDLKEIAERQGVTANTVRTHLKRVFEKTGTKRQSELVSLFLRSPLFTRLR